MHSFTGDFDTFSNEEVAVVVIVTRDDVDMTGSNAMFALYMYVC